MINGIRRKGAIELFFFRYDRDPELELLADGDDVTAGADSAFGLLAQQELERYFESLPWARPRPVSTTTDEADQ